MSGFVYVLSNPSMPGLVKVGFTKHHPKERAAQLWTTGVPAPFVIEAAIWCEDAREVEQVVHARLELDGHRYADTREFFECDPMAAVTEVIEACFDAYFLVDEFGVLPKATTAFVQKVTGCHFTEVPRILSRVSNVAFLDAYSAVRGERDGVA